MDKEELTLTHTLTRRSALKVGALGIAALAAGLPQPTSAATPPSLWLSAYGSRSENKIAITIDDFNSTWVVQNKLLPLLDANPDIKITIFPIGIQIPRLEAALPGLWWNFLARGHEIGFHSVNHTNLGRASLDTLRDEIATTNRYIREATGNYNFNLRYCRPPYGDYGDKTNFRSIAQELGLIWLMWSSVPSVLAETASFDDPHAITWGDITLFHTTGSDMYWLEKYITACHARGLAMVSASQMALVALE